MTQAMDPFTDSFTVHSFSIAHGHSLQQPLHRHPNTVELLLVLEGNVRCTIANKPYIASSGTVLTIQAGTWHQQMCSAREQQSGYKLTFTHNCSGTPSSLALLPPHFQVLDPKGLETLIILLQRETAQPQAHSKQMAHYLTGLILTLLSRSAVTDNSVTYRNFEKTILEIKHYIEENHPRPLTLETIATRFSLNKYQLARLFKEYTGISPLQYIISCRLDTAKQLLATTANPVHSIASAIGYKSDTQFQTAFKKAVGVTPRQYRLSHKLENDIQKEGFLLK